MTPDLLRDAGTALYGPLWRVPLGNALGVSERTVRRWASGEWPVPSNVWGELRPLLEARSVELASVRRKLPRS